MGISEAIRATGSLSFYSNTLPFGCTGVLLEGLSAENCLDGDESALLEQLGGDARRKTAQTQESSLWDQMYSHGMRFLDIRFDGRTWNGKKYPLQHIFFVKDQVDTLEKALAVVNDFVTENPTEFIVVSVRTNGCGGFHGNVRADIESMIAGLSNLRQMKSVDLETLVNDLQGVGLVDLQEDLVLEDYPGPGSNGGLDPEGILPYSCRTRDWTGLLLEDGALGSSRLSKVYYFNL